MQCASLEIVSLCGAQAVYQRVLVLGYVDELLMRSKVAFCNHLKSLAPADRNNAHPLSSFTPLFEAMHSELEQRALTERKQKIANKPRSFVDSKKFANTRQGNKQSCAVGSGKLVGTTSTEVHAMSAGSMPGGVGVDKDGNGVSGNGEGDASDDTTDIAANIAKLKAAGLPPRRKSSTKGGKEEDAKNEGKKGKEARVWDTNDVKGGSKQQLDFSKKEDKGSARAKVFRGKQVRKAAPWFI